MNTKRTFITFLVISLAMLGSSLLLLLPSLFGFSDRRGLPFLHHLFRSEVVTLITILLQAFVFYGIPTLSVIGAVISIRIYKKVIGRDRLFAFLLPMLPFIVLLIMSFLAHFIFNRPGGGDYLGLAIMLQWSFLVSGTAVFISVFKNLKTRGRYLLVLLTVLLIVVIIAVIAFFYISKARNIQLNIDSAIHKVTR